MKKDQEQINIKFVKRLFVSIVEVYEQAKNYQDTTASESLKESTIKLCHLNRLFKQHIMIR